MHLRRTSWIALLLIVSLSVGGVMPSAWAERPRILRAATRALVSGAIGAVVALGISSPARNFVVEQKLKATGTFLTHSLAGYAPGAAVPVTLTGAGVAGVTAVGYVGVTASWNSIGALPSPTWIAGRDGSFVGHKGFLPSEHSAPRDFAGWGGLGNLGAAVGAKIARSGRDVYAAVVEHDKTLPFTASSGLLAKAWDDVTRTARGGGRDAVNALGLLGLDVPSTDFLDRGQKTLEAFTLSSALIGGLGFGPLMSGLNGRRSRSAGRY